MTSRSSRHPIANPKVHKSDSATDSIVAMAKDQSSNPSTTSAGFQEDTYAMAHPHTDTQAKVINLAFLTKKPAWRFFYNFKENS